MSKAIDLALVEEAGGFYVSERKVYPRDVSGRFSRLRVIAVWWLLGMFYVFPWLRWGGRQAVLFDLPARKFHVFGLTFWPQDFLFLALLLIVAGVGLFFFTAIAGRLWCGYACPQTVWTEAFLWIERRFEGDRATRMKLDAAPWSSRKVLRKGGKHVAWIVFALWTGFTFVGFFTPIRDLAARAMPFAWGGWETFWVLFYALATWGNAGFLREQVCKYMCPYARFQSAMFDRDTLLIAYDPMRGEPRGPRRRGMASVLERARGLLSLDAGHGLRAARRLAPDRREREPACARHHHLRCRSGRTVAEVRSGGTRRLHRLHDVRAGVPDRHRHPQRPAIRMHRLRRMRGCVRRGDGEDGLSARADPVHDAARGRWKAHAVPAHARVRVRRDPGWR